MSKASAMVKGDSSEDEAVVWDAVRRGLALHKAPGGAIVANEARYVIPLLAAQLSESDDLRLAAERWTVDPSLFGRRVRDLAVELARRVSISLDGVDPFEE